MSFPGIPSLDAAVMAFIQTHFHNTVTDTVFPIITSLGEAGIGWIVLSLVLLCFKKTRRTGGLVLIAMTVTLLFGELTLKNIICRLRPCNVFTDFPMLIARPTSYSFPSGHTSSSFAGSAYFDAPPQKNRLARVHSGSAHRVLPHFSFCPLPYRCPRRHPPRHPRRPSHLLCRQGDSKTTGREAHGTNLNRLFRQIKAARRFHSLRAFSISVQFFLFSSFLSILPTLSVHYARRLPESQ